MEPNKSVLPPGWAKILCFVGVLYAICVLGYILTETVKSLGSRDFHQFWYAGQFIRQGQDPYEAFFAKEPPKLPIHYMDGITVNQYPVAQPELEITPSNTPAMLLLLAPFAFLSWGDAKLSFMIINFILMLITGWLVLRKVPFAGVKLQPIDEFLIFLVYFDLSATRIAIENGQTTLLVFLLMIVSILYVERSWVKSGLALGIALSKYSLSLPVFLFLLYKRNFKAASLAIAVQILGVLGMSAITGSSPVMIVTENVQLFLRLFDQPGIHISRWFEFLSDNHFVSMIPALLMTGVIFFLILFWTRDHYRKATSISQDVIDFHILTILFIWVILVAYHRLYDTLILLFFVVLIFKGLADPSIWHLTSRERNALLVFMMILPLILILPARIVDMFIPEYYGRNSDAVTSFVPILLLGISLFLFRRCLHTLHNKTIRQQRETYGLPTDPHRETQSGWTDHTQPSPGAKRT